MHFNIKYSELLHLYSELSICLPTPHPNSPFQAPSVAAAPSAESPPATASAGAGAAAPTGTANFHDLKKLVAAQLRVGASPATRNRCTVDAEPTPPPAPAPSSAERRRKMSMNGAATWLRNRLSRRPAAGRCLTGQLNAAVGAASDTPDVCSGLADVAEAPATAADVSGGVGGKVNRLISQLEACGHPLRLAGAGGSAQPKQLKATTITATAAKPTNGGGRWRGRNKTPAAAAGDEASLPNADEGNYEPVVVKSLEEFVFV